MGRQSTASKLSDTKKEATDQWKEYLKDDKIQKLGNDLKAYIVIFVGNEGHFEEI